MFLILTSADAEALSGPTLPGKALCPAALTDGRFVLPPSVLEDDHGAAANSYLAGLPLEAVDPALFPATED